MLDYGYVFAKFLHEKLKAKVFAGVHVKCTEQDTMEIVITRTNENLIFRMEIQNLSEKILYGYSTEYATYEVLNKYKKFVQNRIQRKYFKGEV